MDLRTLIDNWQNLDDERLAANRAAKEITTKAEQAKHILLNALEENNLTGAGGSHCLVQVSTKIVPTVGDWDKLYGYITEHDAWDLLQRRIGVRACSQRWEDDVTIPGIIQTEVPNLRRKKLI